MDFPGQDGEVSYSLANLVSKIGVAVNAKLDFDASKLYEALKYQIHVAIDYCHTLDKDDVLWIEVFGGVYGTRGDSQLIVMNRGDRIDCNAMGVSATPNQASQLGALLRL